MAVAAQDPPAQCLTLPGSPASAPSRAAPPLPHLQMPARHEVLASDVVLRRLHGALAAAADRGPQDFADLLLTPGVGARTVAALALVAEIIHGAPSRFTDPARFSLAHGGKDGHPFPVPLKVYDETLRVLKQAVGQARLGRAEKLSALQRLDAHARRLERTAHGPTFEKHVDTERARSHALGGRTVGSPAAASWPLAQGLDGSAVQGEEASGEPQSERPAARFRSGGGRRGIPRAARGP